MSKTMLTTIDNPYDPFTNYDEWLAYDESHGHYSNSMLARVAIHSDELSEADQEQAIENAIDEIISYDAELKFKKARKKSS